MQNKVCIGGWSPLAVVLIVILAAKLDSGISEWCYDALVATFWSHRYKGI